MRHSDLMLAVGKGTELGIAFSEDTPGVVDSFEGSCMPIKCRILPALNRLDQDPLDDVEVDNAEAVGVAAVGEVGERDQTAGMALLCRA